MTINLLTMSHEQLRMGIKKELLVSSNYDIFLCPVCDDVAIDPVIVSCCESPLCGCCFNQTMVSDTDSCKKCHQQVSYGIKSVPFQKQLVKIYERLQLKCEYCNQVMTIKEWNDHDCPLFPTNCVNCGFIASTKCDHDCVEWLKSENHRLLAESISTAENYEKERKVLKEKIERLTVELELFKNQSCRSVNGSTTSTNEKLSFIAKETFASEEIRNKVATAIENALTKGIDIQKSKESVRSMISQTLPGNWNFIARESFDWDAIKFRLIANSFCSFTLNGNKYIVFRRGGSQESIENSFEITEKIRNLK